MEKNFWKNLKKPFLVLAPMDGVTDVVFREILYKTSPPDVYFNEFTNCDALFSKGREPTLKRLKYTENQRPYVVQIWGLKPENYYKTAKLLQELNVDGIDINMGCPDRTVTKNGACSALINNRALAKDIIAATKEGAGNLPVSVKTRIGFSHAITEDWCGFLLEQDIDVLTVHGRTSKELSLVPANWEEIGKVVKLRDSMNKSTLIVGNGDIKSYAEALDKYNKHNVDGVMIGRGVFQNLWVFKKDLEPYIATKSELFELLSWHVTEFEKEYEGRKLDQMKKFFKIYITGFEGAAELRNDLMQTKNAKEVIDIISNS